MQSNRRNIFTEAEGRRTDLATRLEAAARLSLEPGFEPVVIVIIEGAQRRAEILNAEEFDAGLRELLEDGDDE